MKIPFCGQAYTLRSQSLAAQSCINLYPERSEVDPDSIALYGTPGTRRIVTLPGSGGIRQIYVPSVGDAIVVQGSTVYRLNSRFEYAQCHSLDLLTSSGYVSIADNGIVAVLVDGRNGYILDLATNIITRIVSDAFYGADRVAFIDGYFIFNKPDTQQFYISSLYGTDFDGLDFASAEGSPDLLVSLLVDHREVWMFGESTTEVFYNSGNPDFPIERVTGAFLEHGCAAKHSVAKLDNTVFWVGKDGNGSGTVWRANGYTPQRVSTHAIEYAIQSYSRIDDAIAYTYQKDGHAFYVLTFPSASKTWCFDVATNAWHERSYRNPATGKDGRHRSSCLAFYGGKHLVGDYADGRIYHLDSDFYTDDGDPLVSVRTAPVISNDGKRLVHRSLLVEIESGVGYALDPQAVLDSFSDKVKKIIIRCGGVSVPFSMMFAIDDFITTLDDEGIWVKLDSLQVYASHSQQAGMIDWVRDGVSAAINAGSFEADVGYYAPGGGSQALRTYYNPSTDGINYTLNSAEFGVYIHTAQSAGIDMVGCMTPSTTGARLLSLGDGSVGTMINHWSDYYSATGSGYSTGLLSAVRTASNASEIYLNGVQKATSSTASTSLPNAEMWVGYTNGSAGTVTNAKYSLFYAGAPLSATEREAFRTALITYLAAIA